MDKFMKRIVLSLVASLFLPSLALASDRDENFMEPRISRTQKLESQLQHWKVNLKKATDSKGKKKRRVARIQHCSDMVTNLQAELTQVRKLENKARTNRSSTEVITSSHDSDNHEYLQEALEYKSAAQSEKQPEDFFSTSEDVRIILPSQQEYIKTLSDAYMVEFIPFVDKYKNNMSQAIIPDMLRPRTLVQIPHVDGALELELKGSATSCRKHLQSFVLEFLDGIGRVESAKDTKGVLENVYFEKDIDKTRQNLAEWIENAIKTHNKNAQNNQILRDQFKPQGVKMSRANGMFTMFTSGLLSYDDFSSMIALSQLPVIEHLTLDDQDKIQQMIQTAKIVSFNPNESIIFLVSNFQGIQK